MNRWMNVEELCEHLSVSRDTVYAWISQRGLPAHRAGRLWRFRQTEVDEWLEQNRGRRAPASAGTTARGHEDRMAALAEEFPGFMYLLDPDGKIIVGNIPAPGMIPDEMVNKTAFAFLHPDSADAFRDALASVQRDRRPVTVEVCSMLGNAFTIRLAAKEEGTNLVGILVAAVRISGDDTGAATDPQDHLRISPTNSGVVPAMKAPRKKTADKG
ncbi:MAG: excisionase family DNA-binding protein [Myxococcales bacterium]|nr:excisionase family DNA-binding protein [Myxococcales bacterium]